MRRQRGDGGERGVAHSVLAGAVAPRLILLLGRTIRMTYHCDAPPLAQAGRGGSRIFAFWHNRFLLMPYIYERVRAGKNICVMASRSRDGQYISDVLDGFGFAVVRGSTSKGGGTAVKGMVESLGGGMDAAVTPDGPRGPLYRVQPGIVIISQLSGAPIYPVSFDANRKGRLKSWDRFIIPMPFSRGAVVFGEEIRVPPDADDAAREAIRARIEGEMRRIDRRAAELAGAAPG